jgi:hypothetical protein
MILRTDCGQESPYADVSSDLLSTDRKPRSPEDRSTAFRFRA